MAQSSDSYHEPYEILAPTTRDMHRALVSVMEELEAIDWYQQRADACDDEGLKQILLHNRDEEIEHAMMGLEWIRRRNPTLDSQMRRYLFTSGSILEVEESAAGGHDHAHASKHLGSGGSLGIGSLRGGDS